MKLKDEFSVCFNGVIEKIVPIEGADKIVQAWISGWECVIQKDTFNVGDLVVIAVDGAVIPFELAEKLNITSYLKHKKQTNEYVVKTTKLKGVYSSATIIRKGDIFVLNEDLGTELGIYKYEEPVKPIQLSNGKTIKIKANSNFHVYHKFPNAKNAPEKLFQDEVVVTRKYHGTNARYSLILKNKLSFWDKIKRFFKLLKPIDKYEFIYGSHNVQKNSNNLVTGFYRNDVWGQTALQLNLMEKLKWLFDLIDNTGTGIIIYGEIYGPGIQKHYDYGSDVLQFKIFDISINGVYQNHQEVVAIAKYLDCDYINELYTGTSLTYDEYQERFNIGKTFTNLQGKQIPHEGIVVKNVNGDRNSVVKIINPEYLEFQGKTSDSTDFH